MLARSDRWLFTVLMLGCLASASAGQTILRVRAGAPAGGNGASWLSAFGTVQEAINATTGAATEIWIAGGTYYPTVPQPANEPRTVALRNLKSNTSFYGGFAGNELTRAERNPGVTPTIFSGDIGVQGDPDDNAYRVIEVNAVSNVLFEDVIFEKGVADGPANNTGAAMNINNSLVTLRRVTFRGCEANNGGALLLQAANGATLIEGCVFEGNRASSQGGGVFVNSQPGAVITFNGCRFVSNSAGVGGGVAVTRAASITFGVSAVHGATRFEFNRAVTNGGAVYRQANNIVPMTFDGVTLADNTVGDPVLGGNASGGALSFQAPVSNTAEDLFIDCTFSNNRNIALPVNNLGGGAASLSESRARFLRCRFLGNSTGLGSNGRGGALNLTGSQATVDTAAPRAVFDRCDFVGNEARDAIGGAIRTFQVVLEARNCGFHGNVAGFGGYAVYHDRPVPKGLGGFRGPRLVNCVFTGNTCTLRETPDQFGSLCALNGSVGTVNSRGDIEMVNCTMTRNYGDLNAGVFIGWDGITPRPEPVLTSCVLWNNGARPLPHSFYSREFDATNPPLIPGGLLLNNPSSFATFNGVTFSCIQGLITSASGNTGSDPAMVDPDGADNIIGTADDNPRLQPNSVCVDTGSNAALDLLADPRDDDSDGVTSEPVPLDYGGSRRVIDVPGQPAGTTGAVVDMGAYETPPPANVAQAFWVEPLGGAYGSATNWSPRVPGAGDQMVFDLGAAYEVNLSANASAGSLLVRNDAVTLNLGGRKLTLLDATTPMVVGADGPLGSTPADFGELVLNGGSLQSVAALLANGPGTAADVMLSAAQWTNTGSQFCVGCLGSASLRIGGGSRVSTPFATLGQQLGASGTIDVFGAGSSWASSLLTVVQSGTLLVRDQATASCGFGGLLLLQGGALAGNSSVSGAVLNFGTVAPGAVVPSAGAPFSAGVLTLASGYQQVGTLPDAGQASGSLRVELGASANDRVDVGGTALLAGGLFVTLEPGFLPPPGAVGGSAYAATILRAGSIGEVPGVLPANDAFDVALFPGLPGGRYFQLQYGEEGGQRVVKVVQALLGGEIQTGQGSTYNADGAPADAVIARIDADTYPDLILAVPSVSPGGVGTATILKNRGVGAGGWDGFEAPALQVSYTVGVDPVDLAVADFDGDGRSDIVVVNRGSGTVQVLLNTSASGGLSMQALTAVPVGPSPGGVAATDYNRDGRRDIVVTVRESETSGVLVPMLNLGLQGPTWLGFQAETPIPVGSGPTAVAAGNLEGGSSDPNGPDIVVANGGDDDAPGSTLSVLFNRGAAGTAAARFSGGPVLNVGAGPSQIILCDLESDKDTETLTSIITVNLPPIIGGDRGVGDVGSLSVVRVNNDGSFSPPVTFPVGYHPSSAAVSDLDLDGDLDLAVVTRTDEGATGAVVRVLRNDTPPPAPGQPLQQVALAPLTTDLPTSGNGTIVVAADVDVDTDSDLVVVNAETLSLRGDDRGAVPTSNVTVLPSALRTPVPAACLGDFNNDNAVNTPDLTYFLGRFGRSFPIGSERADMNGDGVVNTADLTRFLGRFGQACQ